MIDSNKIVEVLRTIKDPKTNQDIIEAKRVSNLKIDKNNISFSLDNAGMDDNVKSKIHFSCMEVIQNIYPDVEVHVHMSANNQAGNNRALPQVKNIIAVASGKGGVGKSTVSVNLAYGLAKKGYKVGILDADLYGPSIPTMLGMQGKRPKVEMLYGKHKIVPLEHEGVSVMSIGFVVSPEQAVVLRGPRLGGIIKQFINDCLWPELDFLVIDLPPGTGDIQLTLVQTVPLTGAVIVSTPQEVAVVDAVKAINMFMLENVNVPIIGVVENMSWFTPEELPDSKYYIFGKGGGEKLAEVSETKLLANIPLVQGIREGGDNGTPIVLQKNHLASDAFEQLVNNFVLQVELRNKNLAPTEPVKMNS